MHNVMSLPMSDVMAICCFL